MSNIAEHKCNITTAEYKSSKNRNKKRGECWMFNVNNQFPVSCTYTDGKKTTLTVDAPHRGYSIQSALKNGMLNGPSIIRNEKNIEIASLTFVDGIANGPCELYDEQGRLFFCGCFKNGYRQGQGREYDEKGYLIFEGLFDKGKRTSIVAVRRMEGYWRVVNDKNELISVSKMDDMGRNQDVCYIYSNGKIDRVSKWKNGIEISILKRFEGKKMTEYVDGSRIYEGEYRNSVEDHYPREGKGDEYDVDGKSIVYHGYFWNGRRHGEGISYQNGKKGHDGMWFNGYPYEPLQNCFCIVMIIIIIIIFIKHYKYKYRLIILCFFLIHLTTVPYTNVGSGLDLCIQKLMQLRHNLIVDDKSCTSTNEFILDSYIFESIIIGSECFISVKDFKINGLNRLKSLKIGENSFTQLKKSDWSRYRANNKSRSFKLSNCDELEYIEIGEYSFSDYGGGFELKNLPKLTTIKIGNIGSDSYNFYYSSFVVEGIVVMNLVMNRSA